MQRYLLGIDVGTGGSKALLIDDAGHVKAACTTPYPLLTPRPNWSEQHPDDWWTATVTSIATVLRESGVDPNHVVGVGVSGQMHGLVLIDAAGTVLRPAILWNDQRTAEQCAAIHRRVGQSVVQSIAGKPALTGFTAPKILWVKDHEPTVFAAIDGILLPKDYVRFRLTGARHCDVADASGTLLFDVQERTWSDTLTDALDVPARWLPEVFESPIPSSTISRAASGATGVPVGVPVVAGAGDQAAEAVGCGIVAHDEVSVTIGTSGVVFAATNDFTSDADGRLHAYCHAVPGMWHLMGVMLSAGGSLRWFRDTLCADLVALAHEEGRDAYDLLIEDASGVPAGCEGLQFLPYLTGERTPHADPNARGAFVGLSLRHDRAAMTRAVLEGVTFGLMDSVMLARDMGITVDRVRVSGGGARSVTWCRLMADVFDATVVPVTVSQGAAFGAALLAGAGVGVWPDVPTAARHAVGESEVVEPGPDRAVYAGCYQHYRSLYPALAPCFDSAARR